MSNIISTMDLNCFASWSSIIGLGITIITFFKVKSTQKELNKFRDKVLFNARSEEILSKIDSINNSLIIILPKLDQEDIQKHINNLIIEFSSLKKIIKNHPDIPKIAKRLSTYLKSKYVKNKLVNKTKLRCFTKNNNEVTIDELRDLFLAIQRCISDITDLKKNNNITSN